ncbi:hypothetical protein TCON_0871 [Astathelohania contejeani]|uniref:Ankyrin repeat protein n=1 Tax=Astathelohania contejeani TaxID=164912 RepID=A0ABQ7I0I3_9MICR|nr:hypothetical protein TCON_0871 [Thelohania contejeani]
MDLYEMIDNLSHQKIIFLVEKERNNIITLINNEYSIYTNIPTLGNVSQLNALQYTISKMIKIKIWSKRTEKSIQETDYGELKLILYTLLSRSNECVLDHIDSSGNNCLHYAALLGEQPIVKRMLDEGVKIVTNKNGKYAYELCEADLVVDLLKKWTRSIIRKKQISTKEDKNIPEKELNPDVLASSQYVNDDLCLINNILNQTEKSIPNKIQPTNKASECPKTKDNKQIIINNLEQEDETIKEIINENPTESNQMINLYTGRVFYISKSRGSINREIKYDNRNKMQKMVKPIFKDIFIGKYPGFIIIHLQKIKDFNFLRENIKEIFVKCYVGEVMAGSSVIKPIKNNEILTEQTLVLPVIDSEAKLRIDLYGVENEKVKRMCHSSIKIKDLLDNDNDIGKGEDFTSETRLIKFYRKEEKILHYPLNIHNRIRTYEFDMKCNIKYEGIKETIMWHIDPGHILSGIIEAKLAYISGAELKIIPGGIPSSLESVYNWVEKRDYCYGLWYKGLCNVRGEPNSSYQWRRRYLHCYGYQIFVFNEFTGDILASIDFYGAKLNIALDGEFVMDKTIGLDLGDNIYEFNFINNGDYIYFKSVSELLLS